MAKPSAAGLYESEVQVICMLRPTKQLKGHVMPTCFRGAKSQATIGSRPRHTLTERARNIPCRATLMDAESLLMPQISQVYLIETCVAAAAAFVILAYPARPRGWARRDLLRAQDSGIHGKGVFASCTIARGTVLGGYPGRPRTPDQMISKCLAVPSSKGYAFQTEAGVYLDPTDERGVPSAWPAPGLPWTACDELLAYVNEPPPGGVGVNCFVTDGPTPLDLHFTTSRDIQAGEEIFIDYGGMYDRSSYAGGSQPPSS